MGQAITVRTDYSSSEVRRFAKRAKDDRVHFASIASDQGVNPDTPTMLAVSALGRGR